MKKHLFAIALAAATLSSQAWAQASSLGGFSVGLNAGSIRATSELLSGAGGTSDNTKATADVQLQYALALQNKFLLGFGVTLGTEGIPAGVVGGRDYNISDRIAYDFSPGVMVTKDIALFAKVSALTATIVTNNSSTAVGGIGYGIGARMALTKNLYGQLGYELARYDEKTDTRNATFKNKSASYLIGVGYKF